MKAEKFVMTGRSIRRHAPWSRWP